MKLRSEEYLMVPIELYDKLSKHFYQTREVKLIDAEEVEEDYEFVDFQEMFTEEKVKPFSGDSFVSDKIVGYNSSSDYYKKYFVSANPEDDDGVIGGDLIS